MNIVEGKIFLYVESTHKLSFLANVLGSLTRQIHVFNKQYKCKFNLTCPQSDKK